METKILSMKQCVEPESTRMTMVTEGIKLEVSCIVKEFGLERVDALRHSSIVAPIRSMQPWSGTRAGGLLPNFWLYGSRAGLILGGRGCASLCSGRFCCSPWQCDQVCHRVDRGFDPSNIVSLAE